MKNTLIKILVLTLALLMAIGPLTASADAPYITYIYGYGQQALESPHAYVPYKIYESAKMEYGALKDAQDLYVDKNTNYVYIADTGNNRIVCLDENFNLRFVLDWFFSDMTIPVTAEDGIYEVDENGQLQYPIGEDGNGYYIYNDEGHAYVIRDAEGNRMFIEGFVLEVNVEALEELWASKNIDITQQLEDRLKEAYDSALSEAIQDAANAGNDFDEEAFELTEEEKALVRQTLIIEHLEEDEVPYDKVPTTFYPEDSKGRVLPLGTCATEVPQDFIDTYMPGWQVGDKPQPVIEKEDQRPVVMQYVDGFNKPQGLFVWDNGDIYVADTENMRLVVFDKEGNFKRIIQAPESDIFPAQFTYKPKALAVDGAGRLYVVASSANWGILSMTPDGEFESFLGAQKVRPRLFDLFTQLFMSEKKRRLLVKTVPTEYNNITIDEGGFMYATISSIADYTQQAYIWARDKSGDYSPVKKLSPSGVDVMKRFGSWPPSGEVDVEMGSAYVYGSSKFGASTIVDVALGPNDTWSILDQKRSRVFTYDEEGRCLFIFGCPGNQFGNFSKATAMAYQGELIVVLDAGNQSITTFKRTEYGDAIVQAITLHAERKYDESVAYWQDILKRNTNFEIAYVGIGKSLLRKEQNKEAMEQFKQAFDTENYSKAFKAYRKEVIEKYILLIPVAAVLIYFALKAFSKHVTKVNLKGQKEIRKRTLWEELMYGFHIIVHPFDGFWDMKHEKRGGVRGATVYILLTVLTFVFQSVGKGYIFDPYAAYSDVSIFSSVATIALPVLLWCTANWALTTLFDGEGSFKDIYMATGYSLVPLIMFLIPWTIASNFITLEEASLLNFFSTLAYVWTGLLLFLGSMVVHDYSFGKNILTVIGSIAGMGVVIFLVSLFMNLTTQIYNFIRSIVNEITYRM